MTQRVTERSIEGRDSVGLYLDEIAKVPLLDAVTEVELSKTIEAGLVAEYVLDPITNDSENLSDKDKLKLQKLGSIATTEELEWLAEEGRKAVDTFITSNLRLVVSLVRKYGYGQMPLLDLIQEGNTGLMRGVEKFDYTKGYKFSTYATWWVRQAITRGIAQQARMVRMPVHVVEQLNQVGGVRKTLERQLGREVEPSEIAAELGITEERVLDLMAWGREHVSLDAPVDDDGDTSLGDLFAQEATPGVDAHILDTEARERLMSLVENLDERAIDILLARYGLTDGRQHKLADIGVVHGISAERVRQLEREALQKLRRIADPDLNPVGVGNRLARTSEAEKQGPPRLTDNASKWIMNLLRVDKLPDDFTQEEAEAFVENMIELHPKYRDKSGKRTHPEAYQALRLHIQGLGASDIHAELPGELPTSAYHASRRSITIILQKKGIEDLNQRFAQFHAEQKKQQPLKDAEVRPSVLTQVAETSELLA